MGALKTVACALAKPENSGVTIGWKRCGAATKGAIELYKVEPSAASPPTRPPFAARMAYRSSARIATRKDADPPSTQRSPYILRLSR